MANGDTAPLTTEEKVVSGQAYLGEMISNLDANARTSLANTIQEGIAGLQGIDATDGAAKSADWLAGHMKFILGELSRVSQTAAGATEFDPAYAGQDMIYERERPYNAVNDFLESIWREYFPHEDYDRFRKAVVDFPANVGEAVSGFGAGVQSAVTGGQQGAQAVGGARDRYLEGYGRGVEGIQQGLGAMPGAIGRSAGQGFSDIGTMARGGADIAGDVADLAGGIPARIQQAAQAIQGLGPMQRPQQWPGDPSANEYRRGPSDNVPAFPRPGLPQQGFQEVINRVLGLLGR